jgi:hypothetical protein
MRLPAACLPVGRVGRDCGIQNIKHLRTYFLKFALCSMLIQVLLTPGHGSESPPAFFIEIQDTVSTVLAVLWESF